MLAGEVIRVYEGLELEPLRTVEAISTSLWVPLEPLPEDTEPADYPFETYRRVVYLPAAQIVHHEGHTFFIYIESGSDLTSRTLFPFTDQI